MRAQGVLCSEAQLDLRFLPLGYLCGALKGRCLPSSFGTPVLLEVEFGGGMDLGQL